MDTGTRGRHRVSKPSSSNRVGCRKGASSESQVLCNRKGEIDSLNYWKSQFMVKEHEENAAAAAIPNEHLIRINRREGEIRIVSQQKDAGKDSQRNYALNKQLSPIQNSPLFHRALRNSREEATIRQRHQLRSPSTQLMASLHHMELKRSNLCKPREEAPPTAPKLTHHIMDDASTENRPSRCAQCPSSIRTASSTRSHRQNLNKLCLHCESNHQKAIDNDEDDDLIFPIEI